MTTAKNLKVLNNKVLRRLSVYKPEDGQFILLTSLLAVVPGIPPQVWLARLIGSGVGGDSRPVKALPLLGRLWNRRITVLVSSLAQVVAHYNEGNIDQAEAFVAAALRHSNAHRMRLRAAVSSRARVLEDKS